VVTEGFEHLTWEDLDRLTRAELAERVRAEVAYWEGVPVEEMGEAEAQAYLTFMQVAKASIDPVGLLGHVSSQLHGVDDGFWDEVPGR